MGTLHVTNGDHAVERLRAAGFGEPVLPWRDVLHDGPVPRGTDDALREVRARFIAERGWLGIQAARDSLARRDATLHAALAEADGEVLLWFEHDLHDQLQLAQVLDAVTRHPARAARLRLVHADDYLGRADAASVHAWHAAAVEPGERELAAGRAVWQAWRSPDPLAIDELAVASRIRVLPHMPAALARAMEELPGRHDGLARSERQLLAAIVAGARTARDAFAAAQAQEAAIYLGDASAAWYLERLSTCHVPLVRRADGGPVRRERTAGASLLGEPPLGDHPLVITRTGERVLAGEADHVALNGIARWLGGTLLDGLSPWRHVDGRVARVPID